VDGDVESAQDVAQTVFMALADNAGTFAPEVVLSHRSDPPLTFFHFLLARLHL
jgi:hypothetical protein